MNTREYLGQFASLRPPGTMRAIRTVAESLGIVLPPEYIDLILASDGLLVELEELDVYIYGSDELVERNDTYETRKWLGDVLRIGDDGGGMGFHLDLSKNRIVAVGSGCPSINDGWLVSTSLTEWIHSRFAVDDSKSEGEHAEFTNVRVSLAKPLAIKELAALKACLGLRESIIQLREKCQQLPVVLLDSELDKVRAAVRGAPHLAAALVVKDREFDVQYTLTPDS